MHNFFSLFQLEFQVTLSDSNSARRLKQRSHDAALTDVTESTAGVGSRPYALVRLESAPLAREFTFLPSAM